MDLLFSMGRERYLKIFVLLDRIWRREIDRQIDRECCEDG